MIPVSTDQHRASGPTVVPLGGALGLDDASVAMCHQLTTLDRARRQRRLGALPSDLLAEVDDALRAALSL